MFQFFVEKGQVRNGHAYITNGDVNHVRNVLRLKAGDRLQIVQEEDPNLYICSIQTADEFQVECLVEEVMPLDTELPARVCLFQGLPKSDKMEWILQKTVELGVSEVVPVATRNAVVKLDEKKAKGKVTRWRAIALAAAKQAKRSLVPEVGDVISFSEAVKRMQEMDAAFLAYEHADSSMQETRDLLGSVKPGQTIGIMIGPEGGFTPEEAEEAQKAGIRVITLGKRILRTETAGMSVLSWLVYILEN
ncbi:MAG: 16S rRNA (uracil(1498)-N(3))-methyltransferase [Lachnospiraceae bacterium]|nr:16S rRNA (uracil(1498)-N(3))-methyltransferase [Lachnospiraceae bacterium]